MTNKEIYNVDRIAAEEAIIHNHECFALSVFLHHILPFNISIQQYRIQY